MFYKLGGGDCKSGMWIKMGHVSDLDLHTVVLRKFGIMLNLFLVLEGFFKHHQFKERKVEQFLTDDIICDSEKTIRQGYID